MSFFNKLFGYKPSPSTNDHAVIVHLDGTGLPDSIYEEYDLATIEDQLEQVIRANRLGEFDGNEIGQGETVLFMYGPNAESLFAGIEATLRAYPLCRGARVVVRSGPPGAPAREVRLPVA